MAPDAPELQWGSALFPEAICGTCWLPVTTAVAPKCPSSVWKFCLCVLSFRKAKRSCFHCAGHPGLLGTPTRPHCRSSQPWLVLTFTACHPPCVVVLHAGVFRCALPGGLRAFMLSLLECDSPIGALVSVVVWLG